MPQGFATMFVAQAWAPLLIHAATVGTCTGTEAIVETTCPSSLSATSCSRSGDAAPRHSMLQAAVQPMVRRDAALLEQPYYSIDDARDAVQANWEAASIAGNTRLSSQNRFGPDDCVRISRSDAGTCLIQTNCEENQDLSKVIFAFMCMNEGQLSTIHTFGQGGFEPRETYDSEIRCETCTSVSQAFNPDSPFLKETLASVLNGQEGKKEDSDEEDKRTSSKESGEDDTSSVKWMVPPPASPTDAKWREASYFGPSSCISTYLSMNGTCVIQTQCKGISLRDVEVGITCLETDGNYKRYLYGKVFFQEEIFDTLTQCVTCTGIGANPTAAGTQLTGAIPKRLIDEVLVLKSKVSDLQTVVSQMKVTEGEGAEASKEVSGSDEDREEKREATESEENVAEGEEEDEEEEAEEGEEEEAEEGTEEEEEEVVEEEEVIEKKGKNGETKEETVVSEEVVEETMDENEEKGGEKKKKVAKKAPAPAPAPGGHSSQSSSSETWTETFISEEELAPAPKPAAAAPASGRRSKHRPADSSSEAQVTLAAAASRKAAREGGHLTDLLKELAQDTTP